MEKKIIVAELLELSDKFDSNGMHEYATTLTKVAKQIFAELNEDELSQFLNQRNERRNTPPKTREEDPEGFEAGWAAYHASNTPEAREQRWQGYNNNPIEVKNLLAKGFMVAMHDFIESINKYGVEPGEYDVPHLKDYNNDKMEMRFMQIMDMYFEGYDPFGGELKDLDMFQQEAGAGGELLSALHDKHKEFYRAVIAGASVEEMVENLPRYAKAYANFVYPVWEALSNTNYSDTPNQQSERRYREWMDSAE